MSRPFRARALAAVLLIAAAGCQDYNFNPVGHCMVQPGNQRFTLSNVSSADVLFVVDDSGSMAGEQDRLAAAFTDFVENLTSTNLGRAQGGLLPLDFHVAVTTSSIFSNRQPSGSVQMCRSDCVGASGTLACCIGNQPVYGPRRCTTAGAGAAQCPVAGTDCRNTCNGRKGALYCCAADGSYPQDSVSAVGGQLVTCAVEGIPCGDLKTHYEWTDTQCTPATRGVSLEGFPYPDGAFVGSTDVAAVRANPRVLHFDKRLYLSSEGRNAQGFTMAELKRFFEENVRVGTCGSPQEQGLQAARHAIESALAGTQLDTHAYDWAQGLTSTGVAASGFTFTSPDGMPKLVSRAVWPTPNSKLVVVYVGDEDDCSSPRDPSGGVVVLNNDPDEFNQDACARDEAETGPHGRKQYPVSSFASYLTGLGRTVGAAFVASTRTRTSPSDPGCFGDSCPGLCCDQACVSELQQAHKADPDYSSSSVYYGLCAAPTQPTPADPSTCTCRYDVCGGQAAGTRFLKTANELKTAGGDVVVGSICGDFRPLLREVAEIVKPPQTLSLPSVPAESAVAILRIATSDGLTRKICGRPLAPLRPNYTRAEAEGTGADWWFTRTAEPGPPYDPSPTATTEPRSVATGFVYINPRGACIANPGETYSADYLGLIPQPERPAPGQPIDIRTGGCDPAVGAAECQTKLGGQIADWECSPLPGDVNWGTCNCRSGS